MAPDFATLDSGATASMIPMEKVIDRRLKMAAITGGPTVRFADDNVTDPVKYKVQMSDWLCAHVVKGLAETLISVRDFTKHGDEVVFTSGGGSINRDGHELMKIHMISDQYYIDLNKLENIPMAKKLIASNITMKAYSASLGVHERIKDLHERMGHAHPIVMARAVDGEASCWSDSGLTSQQIIDYYKVSSNKCLCLLAYRNRPKKKKRVSAKSVIPGEIVSADPIFKIYPESYDRNLGAFLFSDEATGFLHVFVGRHKSQFFECLRAVWLWYKSWGFPMKFLLTDSEAVVTSQELTEWLLDNDVHQRRSVPYEHWQNFVERDVQSFNNGVATLMNGQRYLTAKYWPLAAFHWVNVHNKTPNVATGSLSPWQIITKERLTVSNQFLFKFGEPVCVPVVSPEKLWRFDSKNDVGIYVGQPSGMVNGSSVFYPWSGKIFERGSLSKITANVEDIDKWIGVRNEMMLGNLSEGQIHQKLRDELNSVRDKMEFLLTGKEPLKDSPIVTGDTIIEGDQLQEVLKINRRNPRRACRSANRVWVNGVHGLDNQKLLKCLNVVLDERSIDFDIIQHDMSVAKDEFEEFMGYKAKVRSDKNPTVRKAMASENKLGWIAAMKKEWNSLIFDTDMRKRSLSSGVHRSDVGTGRGESSIRSTWQLLEKLDKDGKHEKYKARCCASGDMLKEVIEETFSPTVNSLTCMFMQNIALIDDMIEASADTVGAFLYPPYPTDKSPLYLQLEDIVADIVGEPRGLWYRFENYIYGLPDAGKAFYEMYREHLESFGYKVTISDPCLFVRRLDEEVIFIWIHVDDTYVCANTQRVVDEFFVNMQLKFEITIKDEVDSYIGIKREKLSNGDLKLSQPKLLKKLFDVWNVNESNKDLYPSKQYISDKLTENRQPVDRIMYLTLLGGLIYLLKTRLDIGFAVSYAATKSTAPDTVDWMELKTVLHYLYNTQSYGLVLEKCKPGCELVLDCSVDASYLTHRDSHSHSCYTLKFGHQGAFFSKSVKQSTVATSSCHAENIAMMMLIKEICFIERLAMEIGRPIRLPIIIHEDNDALITLMKQDGGVSKRTKHFMMLIHFCREKVKHGLIAVEHIDSELNIADIGSKPIFGQDFRFKRQGLIGLQEGEHQELPIKRVKKIVTFDV